MSMGNNFTKSTKKKLAIYDLHMHAGVRSILQKKNYEVCKFSVEKIEKSSNSEWYGYLLKILRKMIY